MKHLSVTIGKTGRARLLGAVALMLGASPIAAAPPSLYAVPVANTDRASALDPGSPGIDSHGTAYVRADDALIVRPRGGAARTIDFKSAAATAVNRDLFAGKPAWDGGADTSSMTAPTIVFDDKDVAYTVLIPRNSNLAHAVLLWSSDLCRTWHAIALSGRSATIEKRDSFNDFSGPPTVVSFENYGNYSGPNLWLETFRWAEDAVTRDTPATLVTNHSLVVPNHSGGGNTTFTTKAKIFIAFDSTGPKAQGTAEFVRQYDRATRAFDGPEIRIGSSLTTAGPDAHDLPALTMGPDGKPVVVIGAHHAMLQMLVSKAAGSVIDGWSSPSLVGQPAQGNLYGSYSYVSLNTSRSGTMNIFARAEGDHYRFQLVQLRKPWNKPWEVWPDNLVQRIIANPQRTFYVAWRQQVTMDKAGRLYLNFRYFADDLTDDEARAANVTGGPTSGCRIGRCWYINAPTLAPTTLVSDDDGETWHQP